MMMSVPAQLVLPIGIDETHRFDNFDDLSNPGLLAYLMSHLERRGGDVALQYEGMVLWGPANAGKTHLLSAIAQQLQQQGEQAVWLMPDRQVSHAHKEPSRVPVYLLDELEAFVEDAEAERRLLTLIEDIKRQNALLVMTARHAVKGQKIGLADLFSRLQALDSFEIYPLQELQKREVLRQRAYLRGIVLNDDVLNWLFTHTSRELDMLLDLLERIDAHSLSQKRKVTIPLLKAMLASQ